MKIADMLPRTWNGLFAHQLGDLQRHPKAERGCCRSRGDDFYGHISKIGLLPVIQSRALIERTVRGTAFDKNSQFPCIKIEKTPDKTSRLATTFVRHMLFSFQHTFTQRLCLTVSHSLPELPAPATQAVPLTSLPGQYE